MFKRALDLDLELYLINQIAVDDFVLSHALEGINLFSAPPPHFLDNAERTLAKALLSVEELEAI
jgi:hypothetical protein